MGMQLTIENLLGLMLRISDNIATDLLFREAGGGSAINARMKKLGIEGMRVDRDTRGIIASWLGSEAFYLPARRRTCWQELASVR